MQYNIGLQNVDPEIEIHYTFGDMVFWKARTMQCNIWGIRGDPKDHSTELHHKNLL